MSFFKKSRKRLPTHVFWLRSGSPLDGMSGLKMKPGAAADATLWDVPPLRQSKRPEQPQS